MIRVVIPHHLRDSGYVKVGGSDWLSVDSAGGVHAASMPIPMINSEVFFMRFWIIRGQIKDFSRAAAHLEQASLSEINIFCEHIQWDGGIARSVVVLHLH